MATLNRRLALLTAENERARIARELHDGVAKTLYGLEYEAAALGRLVALDPGRAAEKADYIRRVCAGEARELRAVIHGLRCQYDRLLAEIVREEIEAWRVQTGIPVDLRCAGPPGRVAPHARYEVVAILREALENIRRHAHAGRVAVSLEIGDDLQLDIRDDGVGIANAASAVDHRPYGIRGMRERAERLGGRLTVAPADGGGTRIRVTVPAAGGASAAGDGRPNPSLPPAPVGDSSMLAPADGAGARPRGWRAGRIDRWRLLARRPTGAAAAKGSRRLDG